MCGIGVLLLFGCLFAVLRPRSHEAEGEVFIHRWMDGLGLDLFLTLPTRKGRMVGLGLLDLAWGDGV